MVPGSNPGPGIHLVFPGVFSQEAEDLYWIFCSGYAVTSGFLIVLEGIDGSGKTTQARKLVRWLRKKGIPARYTAEPTGSAVGRILKAMARRRNVDPRVEAMLFAADRLIHLEKTVKPLLERGFTVVSDRYLHSSLAYQSASMGNRRWIEELNRFAVKPDLAILLDVAPEVGLSRIKRKKSRFERIEFLRKVRENYLEYVERGELVRINAEEAIEEVFSKIIGVVEEFLERRR